MKYLSLLLTFYITFQSISQEASNLKVDTLYRFVLSDAQEFIGYIRQEDSREIRVDLVNGKTVYLPIYKVSERCIVSNEDFKKDGTYVGKETYFSSYFFSSTALTRKKGAHYGQWNALGPMFHFSPSDRCEIGIFSSWSAVPVGAHVKFSLWKHNNFAFGCGTMLATGSWGARDYAMATPYVVSTFGDLKKNLSLGIGYGLFNIANRREDHAMVTIGYLSKKSAKISFVLDAIIFLPGKKSWEYVSTLKYDPNLGKDIEITSYEQIANPTMWAFIPGIRWNKSSDKSFQFGFSGIYYRYQFVPLPIIQWTRTFN